ncbi:serine/threonine-protein phosphatase 7 long form-like protein [Cucumis melo var. makuwa]|uniref:Serine/threonine-protein phosphatase 7 long form-like protein n=1 Tax=Cucumis melo var. makuwa TaxID=1194695 RepID=A0A5A7V6Z6_CUCMM|nr:serine/threonine-protein phosphatase 7 long form-like protein [Cucumis melo var. makuwa]
MTLQDVEVLLGISVDGEPCISQMHEDGINLCQMLLGVVPPTNKIKGSRLNLTWLASQFPGPDDNAEEEIVIRYARAYILQIIGGSLFSNKSGSFVHLMFHYWVIYMRRVDTCGVERAWHGCIDNYAKHRSEMFVTLLVH